VRASDPTGLHRVLDEAVVLPQAAQRLDTRKELWPDEVRIRVERLNLDAASFRQLERKHDENGDAVRREVLDIVATRGKMQNPETGSGGMLVGTVEEVGPESPLGLQVGDHVSTLVSLTLTPLVIEDGLAGWDGCSEQVPVDGYAILFGRSIAARLPEDLGADRVPDSPVLALELAERRGVEVEPLDADPDLVGPQVAAGVETLGGLGQDDGVVEDAVETGRITLADRHGGCSSVDSGR
jgi:L-erythro-3,5-diaminohexanoate dehydrogenase